MAIYCRGPWSAGGNLKAAWPGSVRSTTGAASASRSSRAKCLHLGSVVAGIASLTAPANLLASGRLPGGRLIASESMLLRVLWGRKNDRFAPAWDAFVVQRVAPVRLNDRGG